MLIKAKTIKGYNLESLDGEIGKAAEFYFDDLHWTIRYLAANTGNWLFGRHVLISPYALVAVIKAEKCIAVELTKKQIAESPSLDSDKPVSQQFEEAYNRYYEWPMYWGGSNTWGSYPSIVRDREKWRKSTGAEKTRNSNLHSMNEVSGYHIQVADGEIGHVEDFIIDDETWAIRYLVIATRNWLPGKKVLVSPQWIERVGWSESKIFIHILREAIKLSPEFTGESLLTRDYEIELHRHYNRPGYWVDIPAGSGHSS